MSSHHHSHTHVHSHTSVRMRALFWAFLINLVFLIAEVIGGLLSGSMALLADAGHMVSDVAALGTAVWIARAMQRPASASKTYGYGRLEVLSGLLNGILLWGVVVFIAIEAIGRLRNPQEIDTGIMIPIAIAGLVANVASAWILFAHRSHDLNVRQAFLHLAADAAGSIGAILAGFAILLGGWMWMDTLASLLIGILIFSSSWHLVRESFNILLEGTPPNLDLNQVKQDLIQLPEVDGVHDLHAWMIGSGEPMLSAHIVSVKPCNPMAVLKIAKNMISDRYHIAHTTLQVESEPCTGMHEWR